ncbi:unnamed protein product [Cladocopium goreaui]|uniref:RWD domain-containing protein n=1 Tax=Cladocopium goreaui TaxID=2562237 RepID=A0A9P1FNS9_9DINO|nr:unnamed protein product [Cladocopium goreaui]
MDEAAWQSRQLLEIESLSAIYFEEGDFRVDDVARDTLRQAAEDQPPQHSALSLSVRLHRIFGAAVRLAAVLPQGYPGEAVPVVWLEPEIDEANVAAGSMASCLLKIAEDDHLCGRLQDTAQQLGEKGEECMLPLIQEAQELIQSWVDDIAVAGLMADGDRLVAMAASIPGDEDEVEDSPMPAPLWQGRRAGGPVTLGRRAMFSHHIIAPSKRQAIKEWAATE